MPFQQEKQSMDLTEEQWERLEPLMPDRLVGDRAYDPDPLDETLEEQGIEMIAPHTKNRKKRKTQDGRKLLGATRGDGK
jgi:hypothetical protein